MLNIFQVRYLEPGMSTVSDKIIDYLGGYSSVPDDYPLVLGCEEHVSSLGVFVA